MRCHRLFSAFLLLWLTGCAFSAMAASPPATRGGRHALLIIIGNYGAGLPRLAGAAHDLEHARTMARHLGVPEEHIHVLRDREAGADAIRRTAAELALRLAPSDQVMLYFSGLGSRRADMDRPGGCEETFIAADGVRLGHGELGSYFLPVAERADKTVAFFDACNSAQRGAGGLTARCVPPAPGEDCRQGSNLRWRGFVTELRKLAVPTANVAALLASRPEDATFDDAASGGVFTGAARHCLAGGSPDLDSSGAISLGEIAACAQKQVNRRGPEGRTPQLALSGNRGYAPLVASGGGRGSLPALFEELLAGRDGRRDLVLASVRPPGGEGIGISVRASSVGYLYLLAADPAGSYTLLFPNPGEHDNRLRPGETFLWPRPGGRLALPRGTPLLAVLADNERDAALLPGGGTRPVADDLAGRQALHGFVTTSLRAGEGPCQASGRARNLSLARACSDAYAAGLILVDPR